MCFSVCSQAQKELLDTELDLYKKIQAGEDTSQLKIKYTQLQLEVLHGLQLLLYILFSDNMIYFFQ